MPREVALDTPEALGRLVSLLQQATPEQRSLIKDALGVREGIKRKRRHGSNADARQFVTRFGECVQPAGFEVTPPQGVYERGPLAVAAWRQRRESGESITDSELDTIVQQAAP